VKKRKSRREQRFPLDLFLLAVALVLIAIVATVHGLREQAKVTTVPRRFTFCGVDVIRGPQDALLYIPAHGRIGGHCPPSVQIREGWVCLNGEDGQPAPDEFGGGDGGGSAGLFIPKTFRANRNLTFRIPGAWTPVTVGNANDKGGGGGSCGEHTIVREAGETDHCGGRL